MNIVLERFNYAPEGTFGRIRAGVLELYTVEQPWNGNKTGESCIPEGVYDLCQRISPVVKRSSGGDFTSGWEVLDVPERSLIMIHPANWPYELQGCIAPGLDYMILSGKQGVSSSRKAFARLMVALAGEKQHSLHIIPYRPQYP